MVKKEDVYTVKKNGTKLLDDNRGDKIYGACYIILKNGEEVHEVMLSTMGDVCNCLGHTNHDKCKHIKMVLDSFKPGLEPLPTS
jgi:hypothetical protein